MFVIPSNLLMLTTLTLSVIMTISSSNWLMIWAAMELNLLSFIPLMNSSKTNQELEASVKYFFSQALGSAILIVFSMMLMSKINYSMWTTN